MPKKKMLVAGAPGLVGFATVKHFAQLEDWQVVEVSRPHAGQHHQATTGGILRLHGHGGLFPPMVQALPRPTVVACPQVKRH